MIFLYYILEETGPEKDSVDGAKYRYWFIISMVITYFNCS